jgi:hypothetical protein
MKGLALFISLLTLAILGIELFNSDHDKTLFKGSAENINLIVPAKLSQEMLSSELKWQKLLEKKELNHSVSEKVDEPNKNELMIGGDKYELFGIFNVEKSIFVLLKNEAGEMLKLKSGDVISENFKLTKINSNTIVFANNNDRVEYKLFEQKQHAEK